MDILLASSNSHKKEELNLLLSPHRIFIPTDFNINFDVEETGTTFEENAMLKARALLSLSKGITDMPVLADDSGLLVDALPGELGVHTARFGSPDGKTLLTAAEKNILLTQRMKGLEKAKRGARFICVLTMLFRDGSEITVKGVSEGSILEEPEAVGGFGYDPVFFNNEAGCSNYALGKDKGRFSHRGKAVRLLLQELENRS